MIEQAAAVAQPSGLPFPIAGAVVSITLSAGAVVSAIGTLVKVSRWMGQRETTEKHLGERLDEIATDVREVRAFLLKRGGGA